MRVRTAAAWCAAAAVGLFFAAPADAQGRDRDRDGMRSHQTAEPPSMEAMMAEWMKYSEPSEHHRLMQPMIGTFHVVGKMWMDPSQSEPQVMTGKSTTEWILGGRFALTHYKSEFMGMPFEGMAMMGYDRFLQQYQSFWWDTMGTMTYQTVGTVTPDGKVFTFNGAMQDPSMGGAMINTREIVRIINNNKHVMVGHHQQPDGSWMKMMELTYTRN